MRTAVKGHIGFRGTKPWMGDSKGIGWCAWVGPLMVTRVRGSKPGVYRRVREIVAFGVAVGWYR